MAVNPARNNRLVGYDLRFQKVRPRNAKAPNIDIHIIHWLDCTQVLYVFEVMDTKLNAAVAKSWAVLFDDQHALPSIYADRRLTE
jgi:hypothetical protein